jgi:hypothetical protein
MLTRHCFGNEYFNTPEEPLRLKQSTPNDSGIIITLEFTEKSKDVDHGPIPPMFVADRRQKYVVPFDSAGDTVWDVAVRPLWLNTVVEKFDATHNPAGVNAPISSPAERGKPLIVGCIAGLTNIVSLFPVLDVNVKCVWAMRLNTDEHTIKHVL